MLRTIVMLRTGISIITWHKLITERSKLLRCQLRFRVTWLKTIRARTCSPNMDICYTGGEKKSSWTNSVPFMVNSNMLHHCVQRQGMFGRFVTVGAHWKSCWSGPSPWPQPKGSALHANEPTREQKKQTKLSNMTKEKQSCQVAKDNRTQNDKTSISFDWATTRHMDTCPMKTWDKRVVWRS